MSLSSVSLRPLESDTQNADAQLQVTFYHFKGEGMWNGVPHVRIISPGDSLNIIDRPASEFDKARFHRQWLFFQADATKNEIVGTPLSQWRTERPEEISDGQLQELLILKFMSVEQVAMASDSQVQRVGIGAQGLRERARSYINSKNAQAAGAELSKAQDELLMLKSAMERMAAQMQAMQSAPPAEKTYRAGAVRRKTGGGWNKGMRGMKRTKKEATADDHNDAPPVGAAGL